MEIAAYLERVVTELALGIGYRTYLDAERLEKAESFIERQFLDAGYSVTRQTFEFRGSRYANLVAELAGSASPARVLVVGAHYDTVRTTPGADDNASGVAGMLALARMLRGTRPARTVRFVAFALEEPPVYRTRNMASYHYASSLAERGEELDGMICLEMIGCFLDAKGSQHYPLPFMGLKFPDRGNFIAMVGNLTSKGFTEGIARSFREATDLPVVTLNAPAFVIGIDFSDHWSFHKFGYRAFMVTDTAFYRNVHYHAPTDLPETLDYGRMAKVVEGLKGAIEVWAKG
jgi:Zn-dependent M28 family amino/carboxypeptidase